MSDRSFNELLDDVAARTPAPGGGSTAAWATAFAAALVEMAAAFSEERSGAERARELRAQALELAERELTAYQPVLDASRLPKDDPTRADKLASALSDAADTPLAIATTAAEVAGLARELAATGNRTLEGDANTAAELANAARRAAARLVEINLSGREADPRLAEARALLG